MRSVKYRYYFDALWWYYYEFLRVIFKLAILIVVPSIYGTRKTTYSDY